MNWAASYVGIPFGMGPGELTCWGLVRRIYGDLLGIDLPSYGEISAHDLLRVARAMARGKDDGWRTVAPPQDLDVCLMRGPQGGASVLHVGVMAGPRHVLHVEAATAAVLVPITHFSVAGRILGYRRRT